MINEHMKVLIAALALPLPALAGYCLQTCRLSSHQLSPHQRLELAFCRPQQANILTRMSVSSACASMCSCWGKVTQNNLKLFYIAMFLLLSYLNSFIMITFYDKFGPAPLLMKMSGTQYLWRGRTHDNKGLVNSLQMTGTVTSKKVADVMEQIDRGLFVPSGEDPYVDHPIPIGYNATISAPHMHAACLELLTKHLQPGMHVLDIGAGTGYLTAVFSLLVGENGRAVGVEHIPELTEKAIQNVKKSKAAHLLSSGALSLHTGDGRQGFPDQAPYDAIHVGAAAAEIPRALIDQLKPGGRMVIPVGDVIQDLIVIDKDPTGDLKKWASSSVRYVPLTDRDLQLGK